MRRDLATALVLFSVALISIGARRAEPMYDPPPIKIPEKASLEAVSKVIQGALLGRGWTIDEKKFPDDEKNDGNEGGVIVSTLHIRVHTVTIKLTFDVEKIEIEYIASTQMRYKEKKGIKYIHPKYTEWIKNLENDIRASLMQLLSLAGERGVAPKNLIRS